MDSVYTVSIPLGITSRVDLNQLRRMVLQFKAEQERAEQEFNQAATPCPACGYRMNLKGSRVFLCRCMYDHIRYQVPEVSYVKPDKLMGLELVVVPS